MEKVLVSSYSFRPSSYYEYALHTKSARESSSWPIKDDFLRHLATRPSIKSKKSPKGMNASASHMLSVFSGFDKYRIDDRIDMTVLTWFSNENALFSGSLDAGAHLTSAEAWKPFS